MRKQILTLGIALITVVSSAQVQRSNNISKRTLEIASQENLLLRNPNNIIDEGFEGYQCFTLDLTPWTTIDVDGLSTYGIEDVTFPHAGEAMSFIVFNPDSTQPSLSSDPSIQPHSGNKFVACFASKPNGGQGNDDWLITPQITIDTTDYNLKFYAKSYTDEWGLEKINVAVSTTSANPEDFTVISGGTPLEVPTSWTQYAYELSAYSGNDIYIAIQCVSFDTFILMIDDITVTDTSSQQDKFELTFEEVPDWSLTFDPWHAYDLDGAYTYSIDQHTFPNNNAPMAFIAFNPETVDPPMTNDPSIQPYNGKRFGACFSSIPPTTNNDWLVSPTVKLGSNSVFSFWAKSYTHDYGPDKFNVGISTEGPDPENFDIISGDNPREAPLTWTKFSYDLSDYSSKDVNLGIQCVSDDNFIFMVDNILVDINADVGEINNITDNVSIYPVPARNYINIESSLKILKIELLNNIGKIVNTIKPDKQKSRINTSKYSNGIYFINIFTNEGIAAKKLVIRK